MTCECVQVLFSDILEHPGLYFISFGVILVINWILSALFESGSNLKQPARMFPYAGWIIALSVLGIFLVFQTAYDIVRAPFKDLCCIFMSIVAMTITLAGIMWHTYFIVLVLRGMPDRSNIPQESKEIFRVPSWTQLMNTYNLKPEQPQALEKV